MEIKPRAQGSVPGILEAPLHKPQPGGGCSINMGRVSCTRRARAVFLLRCDGWDNYSVSGEACARTDVPGACTGTLLASLTSGHRH